MSRYWPHLDPTRPPVDKPKERGRWEGALFVLALGALLVMAVLLTGCVRGERLEGTDTFTYCDRGNRIYYVSGTGIAVVPRDPSCAEGK